MNVLKKLFQSTPAVANAPVRPKVADTPGRFDYASNYQNLTDKLKVQYDYDKAMSLAVGGEYYLIGALEREVLVQCGMKDDSYLIDVGAGSGRLAYALKDMPNLRYLGIDVVPELLQYADKRCARSDWKFEPITGLAIPEGDGQADIVCFFSVLTHLLHEESYRYLQDAKRVLKPGGRIIFSFLEFSVDLQWNIFENMIQQSIDNTEHPLNMFLSTDGVQTFAKHLGMKVVLIHKGDHLFIDIPNPLSLEDGRVINKGTHAFGQSICVLEKE